MNDFVQFFLFMFFFVVDVVGGKVVCFIQGEVGIEMNYGDLFDVVGEWVLQGVFWIYLVDLDVVFGCGSNVLILCKVIKQFKNVNVEFFGGICDDVSFEVVLESGVVCINFGIVVLENLEWVVDVISWYGEVIVVGFDVCGIIFVVCGWMKEGGDFWEVLECLEDVGCSCYVVIDVMKDGMFCGLNFELLCEVILCMLKFVVVFGGIFNFDDIVVFCEFVLLGVEGVIVGKVFYVGVFIFVEVLDVVGD